MSAASPRTAAASLSEFSRSTLYRRWALMLVTVAFAMRLMVPAGFMLDAAPGWPRLILCSGQGAVAPPMHHAGRTMHHGRSDAPAPADHPCAFAAAAFAADVAAQAPIAPLPPIAAIAVAITRFATRPGLGLAAPPPPKTGPPIHA